MIFNRAEIYRPVVNIDRAGNALAQSWQLVVPEHNIEMLELSHRTRFAADQLKIQASHHIMPYLKKTANIKLGDFYFVGGQTYNIVEKVGINESAYFSVWFDDSGLARASHGTTRTYYDFDSLEAGAYVFGAGAMDDVETFTTTPIAFFTRRNVGDFYIYALSESGLTLADKGAGLPPSVDVRFYDPIESGLGRIWTFAGLSVGDYIFNSGSLSGMPPVIVPEPDVFVYDTNIGRSYLSSKSSIGFSIRETGFGGDVSVNVVIMEKPKSFERRWSFEGIAPGSYTFGSGTFSDVNNLTATPDIYAVDTNSGAHYFPTITKTGFVLADIGFGIVPSVNMVIVER